MSLFHGEKQLKPPLTNNRSHWSLDKRVSKASHKSCPKKYNSGRYDRELFSQSSAFVHLYLALIQNWRLYRNGVSPIGSQLYSRGGSIPVHTYIGAPFGVFWMIQSVRTINNHAYRHGLPAPSETRNKLIRHRWRIAATHCNTHLKAFPTTDRRSIEMETSLLFARKFSNKGWGWNETKMIPSWPEIVNEKLVTSRRILVNLSLQRSFFLF